MEYQDVASAYYALTDEPSFLSEDIRPAQFRIEQRYSDFAFTLQFDDKQEHHFFEAKSWKDHLTWDKFKRDILADFAEALKNEVDQESDDRSFFHLVTDTVFNSPLRAFFNDTEKLRNGNIRWQKFDEKHEERNKSVFKSRTSLEEPSQFHKLAWGLTYHRHSKAELENEFESFVRKCSPRNFTDPTTRILNFIHEKDSGVIKRGKIEDYADVSLNPISGSTSSEEVAEIRSRLDEMANEDDYFDQEEIIEKQDAAIRAGDYFEEQSNVSDSSVENHVSSIDESLENIGDAWNTIKNESEAVSERSKILRDKMPEDRASDSE